MNSRKKRIGIIGSGTIGRSLVREFLRTGECEVAFVLVRTLTDRSGLGLPQHVFVTDAEAAAARAVDLVVEAAVPDIVQKTAPRFLEKSDFCAFSSTALADAAFERAVVDRCARAGHSFFVPHGGILGLDGIVDGRDVITGVTMTTRKSGRSMGLDPQTDGVIFEGTVREACLRFPRNVNVQAAVAAAGIGFDRTLSRIIARPDTKTMTHHIAVKGEGLAWDLHVSSQALAGVTGAYTPRSAMGTVRRILGGGGLRFA